MEQKKKWLKKAAVEAEQEVFGVGKFENIDAVHKTYDHTKTVDYCEDEDEVKKDKLNEIILFKKKPKTNSRTTRKKLLKKKSKMN